VKKNNQLERVPDELQKTLDREARNPSSDRKNEIANLLNSDRFIADYDACIWWNGCYYCKDDDSNWYCIKCTF
jgi:hypothetical protein